jgi:anionic cell wall polymer biosynthesis LytR-Cps2A-Psr (LCP) family protein
MNSKKKYIIWTILVLFIAGCIMGYYLWNKPHEKVEDAKAITITATELCRKYSNNEAEANRLYLNKALEVTGTVTDISKNQDGQVVVTILGDDATIEVQCTMRDKDIQIDNGKVITVKGFCSGNTMFDVLLTDCILK